MKTSRSLVVIFALTGAAGFAQSAGQIAQAAANVAGTAVATPANPGAAGVSTATTTALTLPVRGETSITLGINFGVRFVPASRVTVPVAEVLRITAPDNVPLQWRKNGRDLPGETGLTLILPSVQSSDAGTYQAVYADASAAGRGTQSLILGVGPTDRLVNLSTRGFVAGGGDRGLVSGFVVTAAGAQTKKLIVRAIGPSLAQFGIDDALGQPVLKIYDGNGNVYENGFVYPAVVGAPTYETDLADSLARAGAFPLEENARDPVKMMPFIAGTYTAQVTSGDGTSGTVLLEIYEVP